MTINENKEKIAILSVLSDMCSITKFATTDS
jgi:hypothetical protein